MSREKVPVTKVEMASLAEAIDHLIEAWGEARETGFEAQLTVAEMALMATWMRLVDPESDVDAFAALSAQFPVILANMRADAAIGEAVGHA